MLQGIEDQALQTTPVYTRTAWERDWRGRVSFKKYMRSISMSKGVSTATVSLKMRFLLSLLAR